MKLQTKIFGLTSTAAILLGGPLLWTVSQAVHRILLEEVGQRGILAVEQVAEHAAPNFRRASENALLPILQAAQEQTGALFVRAIDRTGLVLAHTNVAEKGKVYVDQDAQTDLQLRRVRAHPAFYKGSPVMEVMSPVWDRSAPALNEDFMLGGVMESGQKEYLGFVELGLPLAPAAATENRLFRRIAGIMALAGGTGILLFFFFMRHILRPVRWLSEGTARIARGQYGALVPAQTNDELGDLSRDFNHMSQVLADTTVSKKALEASQDELMEAQHLAHIGSYQSSPTRNKVTWSEEVYRIFGRDPKLPIPLEEEQKGLFAPESWARFVEARNEALQSGRGYTIDLEIVIPEGATRWITLRGETVRDSNGRAVEIRGTVQDITERKLAQVLIEQRERYFRSLIENTSDLITVLNANGVVQYESPSLTKILGYDPDELLGTSPFEYIHAEDQAMVLQTLQRGPTSPGMPFSCEYRFKHKDGSWRFLESSGTFIPGDGTDSRTVVNSRDVTERLRGDEQRVLLFTAIDQSKDSIVITDAEGVIQYVNPSYERISGYSRADSIGQTPRVLKSGKHDKLFYQKMWAVLKSGEVWQSVLINRRKDGTLFEEEASINPVMNADGKVTHYVAVKRDVTDRRKLEEIVRQSDKMSAVGQLAAGVAHEINNPLGVILGFAQALVRRLPAQDPSELPLKSIEREALRCKNLVQDLLTFSRVSKVGLEPLDLNHVIEGALSLISAQAKVSRIEVRREFSPDLPPFLGNASQVQQVIVNLSSNAIDAMLGAGVLTIKTEHVREGPLAWVSVKVIDGGSGIAPEILPRIFDPFFTTKPVGKGTGLGLSLIHEIVKKHSGTVDVNSRPGHTEFRIKFPVRS